MFFLVIPVFLGHLKSNPLLLALQLRWSIDLSVTAAELTWLASLLRDLGISRPQPALLFCDNMGSLQLTVNPVFHGRTKHVELDYHFIKEKVALGHIQTQYVESANQLVDVFTKALSRAHFHKLQPKMGLLPSPA